MAGLLWNFQSFVRAMALGLQLNRTVIPVARRPGGFHADYSAFDGCNTTARHLGCYFPNITTCEAPNELNFTEFQTWNVSCRGQCAEQNATAAPELLFLSPMNGGYSGWAPDIYEEELWQTLTADPCTYFSDCNATAFSSELDSQPPIFMLHAIISKWCVPAASILSATPFPHWLPLRPTGRASCCWASSIKEGDCSSLPFSGCSTSLAGESIWSRASLT